MRHYIGKDFVHEGCGLLLDESTAWEKIAYSSRKNIKKAEDAGVKVEKVSGNKAEMQILRGMWYEPNDPNLPTHLHEGDQMFIAYDIQNQPVGCCVLVAVDNHLFLNNLAGNEKGKELRVQDYLLWHCVKYFSGSKYKYIDVGVSYRKSLYKFFEKWKVVSYPVIFYKPENAPVITTLPFGLADYTHYRDEKSVEKALNALNHFTGSKPWTFVPGVSFAASVMRTLGLEPIDHTYLFPSVGDSVCFVDLTRIFAVQFGCLIFNLKIEDQELWNSFGCLDFYKREIVFTRLASELIRLEEIIESRRRNFKLLSKLFALDEIQAEPSDELIPSLFHFKSPVNRRFHEKLNEFGVEHSFSLENGILGLPVHQGLNENHLQYLYGIYRGVLNLCSEWLHTSKVSSYKKT